MAGLYNHRGKYLIPILISIFLLIPQFLIGQNKIGSRIAGNIIDAETREPIAYANIFIANSSIGTASDEVGYFELRNVPYGRYEIIASVLGYEVLKANIGIYNNSRRNFRFEMYKHPIEMEEVVVKGKPPRKRRRQLNQFRRNLLGSSQNGKKSYITNEEVIRFEQKGEILIAYSYEPIEIINNGLGYKVFYVLDEYQQSPDEIKYTGYPHFVEQIATTYHDSVDWPENRNNTYLGSLRHFLTTICKNHQITDGDTTERRHVIDRGDSILGGYKLTYGDTTLIDTEGFDVVQVTTPQAIISSRSRRLVNTNWFLSDSKKDNEMYLHFDDCLQVSYYKDFYPFEGRSRYGNKISFIEMTCDSTILDKEGRYFDKYAIRTTGLWAHERVADMLPFDYKIEKE